MNAIGLGILAFYRLDDLKRCIAGVRAHTTRPHRTLVCDNSEDGRNAEWLRRHAPDVVLVKPPYNIGCAAGRNLMASRFAAMGMSHFVLMDDDVRPIKDAWLVDMTLPFLKHEDTGIVGWPLAVRQMGGDEPDDTGAVRQLPGMCNLYSLECVVAAGGWYAPMIHYRFDSLFCQLAAQAGFKTRLVSPDTDAIRHDHPHGGIKRDPQWRAQRAASQRMYLEQCKLHGLPVLFK